MNPAVLAAIYLYLGKYLHTRTRSFIAYAEDQLAIIASEHDRWFVEDQLARLHDELASGRDHGGGGGEIVGGEFRAGEDPSKIGIGRVIRTTANMRSLCPALYTTQNRALQV